MELDRELASFDWRINLIAYLGSLMDRSSQQSGWVEGKFAHPILFDDFDESVHFFFDDTKLSEDAYSCIGYILKNEKEAELIKQMCQLIKDIFTTHGLKLSDAEYINLPEWPAVVAKAKQAYDLVTQD